jgi:hypothetical protein
MLSLAANNGDGGTRRVILVEGEANADTLTAERARRVISVYEFSGTQKQELLCERLSSPTPGLTHRDEGTIPNGCSP